MTWKERILGLKHKEGSRTKWKRWCWGWRSWWSKGQGRGTKESGVNSYKLCMEMSYRNCDFGNSFCDAGHLVTCFRLWHMLFIGTEQMHFVSFFFFRKVVESEEHLYSLSPHHINNTRHCLKHLTAVIVRDLRGHPTKVWGTDSYRREHVVEVTHSFWKRSRWSVVGLGYRMYPYFFFLKVFVLNSSDSSFK